MTENQLAWLRNYKEMLFDKIKEADENSDILEKTYWAGAKVSFEQLTKELGLVIF